MAQDNHLKDAETLATERYDPDRLPILNQRPEQRRQQMIDRGFAHLPPAPHLCSVEELVPYYLVITCGGCESCKEIAPTELMAQGGRVSFEHLVTRLVCDRCGGQIKSIEIGRQSDRPYANHPRQVYEATMCGRYTFTKSVDEIRGLFGFANTPNLQPRYNIAPSQMVPVVAAIGEDRKLGMMTWGLIPSWAKDAKIGFSNINARVETAAEKPAFRSAFKARHCLILADGFYEWEPEGKPKQPWRFTLPDGSAFAIAGLWEKWKNPAGEVVTTFTIITGEPYPEVKPVHNRSPIILAPEAYADWLSCTRSEPSHYLGVPQYRGPLRAYKVSPAVNQAKDNDHPGLIEPIG